MPKLVTGNDIIFTSKHYVKEFTRLNREFKKAERAWKKVHQDLVDELGAKEGKRASRETPEYKELAALEREAEDVWTPMWVGNFNKKEIEEAVKLIRDLYFGFRELSLETAGA